MAESRVKATAAQDAGELDQIADELYGLRADAFAAARDEQVRKARADSALPAGKITSSKEGW